MSSFNRTTSPVLTMASQSAHQLPFDKPFAMQQSSPFGNPSAWSSRSYAQSPITAPPRGRKRSRDEAAVNLDNPEKVPPPVELTQNAEEEWEYGPGMVLIKKKGPGYVGDAGSQSGTWVDEKAAALDAIRTEQALKEQQRQAQDRPSLRSHKSSRLDLSAQVKAQAASSSPTSRTSPNRDLSPLSQPTESGSGPGQPIIDDFTLHLGIGWNRLSEHIQEAARGWARYIENHYPVTEPKILLESKGLESYLVEAREGYFLFAENLRQGRLVSSDPQRALSNLKTSPPVFDDEVTITASTTPRPTGSATASSASLVLSTPSSATTATDIDMEMI
ncbi:hypothetical protein F503_06446 [Ophiostoma piceae UAMH 11346]|uniref:Uncharacterized protein n=1 Tax=Ophiostoma piceae (strain UAMH 11346) TaxID=1262450 RepID=S3CSU3_OPHP1|nr:hypothetical protein F503_06446 [Ophiostoma piceae UAMH 11346]